MCASGGLERALAVDAAEVPCGDEFAVVSLSSRHAHNLWAHNLWEAPDFVAQEVHNLYYQTD